MSRARVAAGVGVVGLLGLAWWLAPSASTAPAVPSEGSTGDATPTAPPPATPAPRRRRPAAPPAPKRPTGGGARPADAVRAEGIELPPVPPPPPATPAEEDAYGSIWPASRDGIENAVFERLGDLHDCYDTYLQVAPDLAGRASVSFVITVDGDVARPREVQLTSDELRHTVFEGCIATVFEELRFEPGGGIQAVTWPLNFEARPE